MPIAFSCPHCGHATNVAERFAGQTGPCSACGQTITVPTLAAGPYATLPRPSNSVGGCLAGAILGLSLLVCIGSLSLLIPNANGARDAARRAACRTNLEQIATAVSLYESDYGCFPPAYTTDADGNRLHSWRTLLLPYLGEEWLSESLDLEQAWDSEANEPWLDIPVSVYQCPADSAGSPSDTSYVMIVGGEGLFDGGEPCKAVEVTDGISQTILLVEVRGSGIPWMEPEDLIWDEMDFAINGAKGICSEHEGGAHAVMCDGAVEFLVDDTLPDEVRAMVTRAGEEPAPGFPDMVGDEIE